MMNHRISQLEQMFAGNKTKDISECCIKLLPQNVAAADLSIDCERELNQLCCNWRRMYLNTQVSKMSLISGSYIEKTKL